MNVRIWMMLVTPLLSVDSDDTQDQQTRRLPLPDIDTHAGPRAPGPMRSAPATAPAVFRAGNTLRRFVRGANDNLRESHRVGSDDGSDWRRRNDDARVHGRISVVQNCTACSANETECLWRAPRAELFRHVEVRHVRATQPRYRLRRATRGTSEPRRRGRA